ncbi:MAG: transporter periplasmic subunit [Herbinix sp.]|jgi:putative aldouronate transport system substrate-binding protein|nr:transporter periplasmic subunit [Herbinix sp.]
MKKRVLTFTLAIFMVFTLVLSGCANKGEEKQENTKPVETDQKEDQSGTEDQTTAVETNEVEYPVDSQGEKLTIWLPIQPPAAKYISSYNDQEVFQEISKMTGIEVEFINPAVGQEKEQLALLIASGELPDIIQIRELYDGGATAGIDDGIFLDLTDLIPQYAPDYYSQITSSEMSYRMATNNDNRICQFDIIKQSAPAYERINFTNAIMDKYGVTEMPVTISDYETIFEKFKQDGLPGFAPIENGQVEQFMWPYGIAPGFFLGEDGNVRWGAGTEEYKEYLTMMNKWYSAGYIYKDFMSNITTNDRRALYSNLQVGMIIDAVDLADSMAKSAGYKVKPANYPRMTAGQPIHFEKVSWEALPDGGSMATVITSSSKNKELALKYMNYFYTQEGADLANWGIKDKTYTEDASGNKTYTDYMFKNDKIALGDAQTMLKIHLFAKLAEPDVVCNPNILANEKGLELRKMYSDDTTIDNSQVLPVLQLSAEAAVERNSIMTDINTYVEEMTLKFITGATPLTEFEKYLETLSSMGINDAIQITQDGYMKFMSKTLPSK